MPIVQPSQYDCDNMESGDIVFVRTVSPLYKFMRKWFYKNKTKIRVRQDWSDTPKYEEFYQEDCILIYAYEVACVQKYDDVVCNISKSINAKVSKTIKLDLLQIGLYNTQIVLNKNTTLTLPTFYFRQAIEKNAETLKTFDDTRKVKEAIKFQKYKGDYFKKYVKDKGIEVWDALYCATCGEKVEFKFKEDNIDIINYCKCGVLKFPLNNITYDEFSLWYANQAVAHPEIAKYYKQFWFKEEKCYCEWQRYRKKI